MGPTQTMRRPHRPSGDPRGERSGAAALLRRRNDRRLTHVEHGHDSFAVRDAYGRARGRVTHDRAGLDVRAESESHRSEGDVLYGHHRGSEVLLADFGIRVLDNRDRNHQRKRRMLLGNLGAQRLSSSGILELLGFASAERGTICVTSLWAEHVEAPWLREAVVRGGYRHVHHWLAGRAGGFVVRGMAGGAGGPQGPPATGLAGRNLNNGERGTVLSPVRK